MKLLTQELSNKFEKINKMGMAEKESYERNPNVIAKYFHPFHSVNWFATEYNPEDRLFFGFVCDLVGDPTCDEWGYFSLDELEALKIHGLPVERDLYFGNPKISEVDKIIKIDGFHKEIKE